MKFSIALLLFFLTASAASHLTIKNAGTAACDTIETIDDSLKYLVPVTEICSKLGFKWQWDRYTQRLTLTSNSARLSFVQDNCFYNLNDSILQLPVAPQRIGATIYLPVQNLLEILRPLCALALRYDPANHVLFTDSTQSAHVSQNNPQLDIEGIKTVVIDPGHGGKDPGCLGDGGIKEKEIALGIALQLREILRKKSKINVFMTRDKDVFIPLNERTKMANEKKADLFVSIHVNSIPGTAKRKEAIRGYKIYFLSQAKNDEDKLVAMQENAVIELEDKPQNYSNLQNVLIDLAGNEYLRESQDLCIILDHKFNSSLNKKIPKLHLGVGQANFWVLNGAYMPSVLIETGFISHSNEEKLLSDKAVQKEIAAAVADAIIDFKGKYENGL
jgi:N-acetylmuramoyl-L-alanine amidase